MEHTLSISLDVLAAEPEQAQRLTPDTAAELLTRLVGLQSLLLGRLLAAPTPHPDPEPGERLLTIPEVAGRLSVPEAYAYELARRGEIPTIRVGKKYVRVPLGALEKWLTVQALDARPHSVYRPRNRKGA